MNKFQKLLTRNKQPYNSMTYKGMANHGLGITDL